MDKWSDFKYISFTLGPGSCWGGLAGTAWLPGLHRDGFAVVCFTEGGSWKRSMKRGLLRLGEKSGELKRIGNGSGSLGFLFASRLRETPFVSKMP